MACEVGLLRLVDPPVLRKLGESAETVVHMVFKRTHAAGELPLDRAFENIVLFGRTAGGAGAAGGASAAGDADVVDEAGAAGGASAAAASSSSSSSSTSSSSSSSSSSSALIVVSGSVPSAMPPRPATVSSFADAFRSGLDILQAVHDAGASNLHTTSRETAIMIIAAGEFVAKYGQGAVEPKAAAQLATLCGHAHAHGVSALTESAATFLRGDIAAISLRMNRAILLRASRARTPEEQRAALTAPMTSADVAELVATATPLSSNGLYLVFANGTGTAAASTLTGAHPGKAKRSVDRRWKEQGALGGALGPTPLACSEKGLFAEVLAEGAEAHASIILAGSIVRATGAGGWGSQLSSSDSDQQADAGVFPSPHARARTPPPPRTSMRASARAHEHAR